MTVVCAVGSMGTMTMEKVRFQDLETHFSILLMNGLIAKGTRKYYRCQSNKTSYVEKDNILHQVFSAKAKNEIR